MYFNWYGYAFYNVQRGLTLFTLNFSQHCSCMSTPYALKVHRSHCAVLFFHNAVQVCEILDSHGGLAEVHVCWDVTLCLRSA